MAIKRESIPVPALPVSEVSIPGLVSETVKIRSALQRDIDSLEDERKRRGVGWSIVLAHLCILADDVQSLYSIEHWEIVQASSREMWESEIVPLLVKANGFDRDTNKKKSTEQKPAS